MNVLIRSLVFIALILSSANLAKEQEIPKITLEESIDFALQKNVLVKNAQLAIAASKATVGETTAQGLPQITGNVDINKNLIVPSQPFPAIFFDPEAQEGEFIAVQFSPEYSGNLGVTVNRSEERRVGQE